MADSIKADTTAKSLFSNIQKMVYQIRVIDVASGDKYSIGSGFHISDTGHLATNFHVVSSFVHEPDKYRLELEKHDGTVVELKLLIIDVIHDLAILHADGTAKIYLPLNVDALEKGEGIYSVGNPQDLGMTIIEGTYNGLVKNSRYRKILFSGSLNAGMSGGPTLNRKGEVIGINVSKGGEQLSFLVPVVHLASLLQKINGGSEQRDFDREISEALFADQEIFYKNILSSPSNLKPLGELRVIDKLTDSLRCWGHTVDEDDIKYEAVHQHCKSEDEIYISRTLYVGEFFYDYEWITTTELNNFQFYTVLEERFKHRNLKSTYEKKNVTEFICHNNFVTLASGSWKISSCLRAYKLYSGLYDVLMLMVSVDHNAKAAIVKMGATGISKDNSLALIKRMMQEVEWTP